MAGLFPGRSYRLWRSVDLLAWEPVALIVPEEGAGGPLEPVTAEWAAPPGPGPVFYRLGW